MARQSVMAGSGGVSILTGLVFLQLLPVQYVMCRKKRGPFFFIVVTDRTMPECG